MSRKKVTIKKDASGKIKDQTEVIETDDVSESESESAGPGLFDIDAMAEVSANLGRGVETEYEFKLYQLHEGKPPEYLRELTKSECSEAFIQTHYPAGGSFQIKGRNVMTGEERSWSVQIRGASGFNNLPVLLGGSGAEGSTTALISLMIAQMNSNQQMMIEQMRLQQQAGEKRTETLITALSPVLAAVLPAIMNRKDPDKELIDTLLKVMQASKGGDSEALGMILDFARSAASEVAKVMNPAAGGTDNPIVAAITQFGPLLQGLFGKFAGGLNPGPGLMAGNPGAPPRRWNGEAVQHHTNAVVPPTGGGAGPSANVGGQPQTQQGPVQNQTLNFKQLFERFVLPDLTKVAKMAKMEQQETGIIWTSYSPSSFAETFKFEILKNYGLAEPQLKEELLTVYPSFEVFSEAYQGIFTGSDGEKLEQWFYDFYVELGGPELPEPGTTAVTAVDGVTVT